MTGDKVAATFESENRKVHWAKILVSIVYVATAAAMTISVYFIAKNSDQNSFEITYDGYTQDIMGLVVWELRYNFALMEQLR